MPARLKICLISEPLHAGVGRFVVEAACELAQRGHEVHVLYSPLRLEPEFLAQMQKHQRVRSHPIVMPRAIGMGDMAAFRDIRNYVKANGPFDIVHGQSSKAGGYARLLKLAGLAKTVLYTPHAFATLSPVTPRAQRFAYRGIERLLAPLSDAILCTSQAEREHGIGIGISPSRLLVVTNGTAAGHNNHRGAGRAELGLRPDQVVVGFIGRMESQKAPEYLIEAVMHLLPELPQLHLLMIGDGPKRAELEDRMQQAGLANRASWLGSVDARKYIAAMDVIALPSLYEGFAYVLIEALHAGLPIVSTPVGGTRESIADGENGILVPHARPLMMAQALRKLSTDSNLRSRMGYASAARAHQFTIPRMVDELEAVYFQKSRPRQSASGKT